ncbi:MCE family protein [Phormidium sp. CLA17]|uniref:MlaD family protein n=1 Tax=Leptolyngbya sp. Cla-17 TaxID=2803751 RepID=UPI001491A3B2|nr:MlaD family protein [Leptolyngbya sp. Cla-17]MBM0741920.1 MCE family protein [Leptolyngbya sp. Cla-17]
MRSRTVREGSVGLLILAGISLFVGIALWLQGVQFGKRSFKIFIEFANTVGLQVGAPVRYRGVNIGKIVGIRPQPNKVEVEAEISPANALIPKNVIAQVNQSGLISQTAIELTPLTQLPASVNTTPLAKDCNQGLILCDQARLSGEPGFSIDELGRATIRFANLYTDPKFFANVNGVVKNTSVAAAEIAALSREFTMLTKDARSELKNLSSSTQAITQTANQLSATAAQVNNLLSTNRATLVSTLDNLNATSGDLRVSIGKLGTVLGKAEQGEFIQNLETLSTNAARASTNLRAASDALNSPANLLVLQQTLDSARATFQNSQKITADLDELTGDPKFRSNLKNLVNGLSGLVSSTQQLQQQTQTAQILAPIAASLTHPAQAPQPDPKPTTIDTLPSKTSSPQLPEGIHQE